MDFDFLNFIKENQLFLKKDKLLLAISGGVDSVVLSHLLFKTGFDFSLAHCNFRLRLESDQETIWVKNLANIYKKPFFFQTFDTQNYADHRGISIQMAARELRYTWFKQLLKKYGYDYILTAHHLNDQIETILFNWTKGTGISGLKGIPEKIDLIRRPLLFASKEKIVDYAKKENLKWLEDPSNQSSKYARNLIRNQVIPLLKTINPNLEKTAQKNIEKAIFTHKLFMDQISEFKTGIVSKQKRKYYLELKKIKTKILPQVTCHLYIYYLLKDWGFNMNQSINLEKIIKKNQVGNSFFSGSHRLIVDRNHLIIEPLHIEKIRENHFINFKDSELILNENEKLVVKKENYHRHFHIDRDKNVATLDYDKLIFPLKVRKWTFGDWFIPFGMKGKKKLSDFFIDIKCSRFDKENIWIIESNKQIVCLVGLRIDNRFKITNKTQQVFEITFQEKYSED